MRDGSRVFLACTCSLSTAVKWTLGDEPRGGRGVIAPAGYGITGMRERAGLLAAGPRPGGGFRVAARLPLPAAAR
jgi:hypothetical protein